MNVMKRCILTIWKKEHRKKEPDFENPVPFIVLSIISNQILISHLYIHHDK